MVTAIESEHMKTDAFIRGILPDIACRYVIATAFSSVQEIWTRHEMTVGPALLIGEAAMAAFLLAARGTKEEDQTVGLHFECTGPVRRLISSGRFDGGIRGYTPEARADWQGSLMDGKGSGTLNVSLFREHSQKVYASSVEFRNQSIARNIEEFLARSEQVQVFVELGPFTDIGTPLFPEPISLQHTGISGYLFEALPGATADDTDRLLEFLKSGMDLLRQRGILPEVPGILSEGRMFHYCDCSKEKVERLIISMGREEADALIVEQGMIEVTCAFCQEKYRFGGSEVKKIFLDNSV